MTESRFTDREHEYLDGSGDGTPEAHRFAEVLAGYREALVRPGEEVDRAVMARIRPPSSIRRPAALLTWLVRPQSLQMRPIAALATLAVLVAAWFMRPNAIEPADEAGPATMLVRFEFAAPQAEDVVLVGTFNDWGEREMRLQRSGATGLWTLTIPLSPGEHEYLFVVDGTEWVPDPSAHAQVDDGFGQTNSVIVVGPRGVVRS